MWNNILLYNNPFKDFFLKRHKNNFNVFIGMIFLIYLQSSDYVYLNTSRNQRQIMSRRWICKHEECGMSSLDQTDTPPYPTSSYSIWSPILRVIKIKKNIQRIWNSSSYLCRAGALNLHVHMSCSIYGKYLQPEEVCWVLFTI